MSSVAFFSALLAVAFGTASSHAIHFEPWAAAGVGNSFKPWTVSCAAVKMSSKYCSRRSSVGGLDNTTVIEAEASEARRSHQLLSLKELKGAPRGTELAPCQLRCLLALGSWLCTFLEHGIVGALLCLFGSLIFKRGSRRHERLCFVFTTMLLHGAAAFLPAAEAVTVGNSAQKTASTANPQVVSSAGSSLRMLDAVQNRASLSASTPTVVSPPDSMPPRVKGASPPPVPAPPPPSGKLRDLSKALVVADSMHVARRLATINVSPGAGTLQTALDNANAGDTLVLADGTFTGSGSNVLEINKDITIRAQNAGQAVLDGENARQVIKISSGTVVLEGLKITKGLAVRHGFHER